MEGSRVRTALVTLVVGAAAYLGAFLLLTAEDRRRRTVLEVEHGAALEEAPAPGPQPSGADAVAVDRWRRAADLREAREEHERRSKTVSLLGYGFAAAFVAQTALTAFLLVKTRARETRARETSERARPAARAPRP